MNEIEKTIDGWWKKRIWEKSNAPEDLKAEINKVAISKDSLMERIEKILDLKSRKFYCTICGRFDCDCSSSECYKIPIGKFRDKLLEEEVKENA